MKPKRSRQSIIERQEQGSKIVDWSNWCSRHTCANCSKRKLCDYEEDKNWAVRILKELQEVAPGGYHHPFASPVIVAERLRKARGYLEYVDKYLDVLQRIAQQEARIEQTQ